MGHGFVNAFDAGRLLIRQRRFARHPQFALGSCACTVRLREVRRQPPCRQLRRRSHSRLRTLQRARRVQGAMTGEDGRRPRQRRIPAIAACCTAPAARRSQIEGLWGLVVRQRRQGGTGQRALLHRRAADESHGLFGSILPVDRRRGRQSTEPLRRTTDARRGCSRQDSVVQSDGAIRR